MVYPAIAICALSCVLIAAWFGPRMFIRDDRPVRAAVRRVLDAERVDVRLQIRHPWPVCSVRIYDTQTLAKWLDASHGLGPTLASRRPLTVSMQIWTDGRLTELLVASPISFASGSVHVHSGSVTARIMGSEIVLPPFPDEIRNGITRWATENESVLDKHWARAKKTEAGSQKRAKRTGIIVDDRPRGP